MNWPRPPAKTSARGAFAAGCRRRSSVSVSGSRTTTKPHSEEKERRKNRRASRGPPQEEAAIAGPRMKPSPKAMPMNPIDRDRCSRGVTSAMQACAWRYCATTPSMIRPRKSITRARRAGDEVADGGAEDAHQQHPACAPRDRRLADERGDEKTGPSKKCRRATKLGGLS